MSSNKSTSTFTSTSFSSYSSSVNGETRSYTEATHSDPSGTKVHRTAQEPGQVPKEERIEYDGSGHRLQEAGSRGRIEDVTDKDLEYEEKMEDEYAKREGGA